MTILYRTATTVPGYLFSVAQVQPDGVVQDPGIFHTTRRIAVAAASYGCVRFVAKRLFGELSGFCVQPFSLQEIHARILSPLRPGHRHGHINRRYGNNLQNGIPELPVAELWEQHPGCPVVPSSPLEIVPDNFNLRPNPTGGIVVGTILGNDQIQCGNVASTFYLVTPMKDATHAFCNEFVCLCSATATGMRAWVPGLRCKSILKPGALQFQ